MFIMRKITKTMLFCMLSVPVFSQSFSTVYESLSVNDRFSNMLNLQHYQSANPEHAVTYYLLAGIYDEYMRETNPITMFDFLQSNYGQIDTYLGLVQAKLDEKQARQDREYFGEIELISDKRKTGLEDIIYETEKRKAAAKEYFENAQTVHNSYVRFANMYNACLFKYREISGNYPNYKTLYLLTTRSLRTEIEKMLSDFDSSLVYFESYQQACSKLSHILKVNTYQLKPITTYRLEGLIESDFTSQVVELWDFKTWASDFLKVMDTDIAEIRTGLSTVNKALNQQTLKFTTENVYSDEHKYYKPDNKFQNLIAKYDPNSLANHLIDYQNLKIQFLLNTRMSINDINDTLDFFLINKLRFYNNLAMQKVALNNEAEKLKSGVSIGEVAKYIEFFGEQYNGMDGFTRWCEVEKYNNDQVFNNNLENLISFIDRDKKEHCFDGTYLEYKKKHIPFGVTKPNDSLVNSSLQINKLLTSRTGISYLIGVEIQENANKKPFVAMVDADRKVEWMKNIENSTIKNYSTAKVQKCNLFDNGEIMLAGTLERIEPDSSFTRNVFVLTYDNKGNEKNFKLFEHLENPNYLLIDEIAEEYLLICSNFENELDSNPLLIAGLYSFNDSLLWEKQFAFDGELVDVVVSNSDFFLVCNYRHIKTDKVELKSDGENLAPATVFITRNGNNLQINQYETDGITKVEHAYKISNSVINFIGTNQKTGAEAQPFYLLVNDNGDLIFSNNKKVNYVVF